MNLFSTEFLLPLFFHDAHKLKGTFYFHLLVTLFLFSSFNEVKSQESLETAISISKNYNDYSAFFLARRSIKEAIKEVKHNEKYNPITLGEAYRVLSLSNYHIGFGLEYADNVDSMYHYKKKSGKRIYFVEYAAYKLRSRLGIIKEG